MRINKRNGIIAAGNWIIDHIKIIDKYPAQDSLANIKHESIGNGGSPYNVLKNLSRLGASFPLKGVGLVGDDDYGRQIRSDCSEHDIDTSLLRILPQTPTSYTDVMTVASTGRRTFFHQRGANAHLDVEHFHFTSCTEKIFHLGYLLLLDALDMIHEDGMSGAARVLKKACEADLKTSVDLVSEDSDRFEKILGPSLPYIHYLFLNEFEAARCTGINLMSDQPDDQSLNRAASKLLDRGVREWVIIHFPHGVFAKNKQGEILRQSSVNVPAEKITSAVGAGDALAAGILYGIHEDWNLIDALRLGVCSAASCLQHVTCSNGVKSYGECLQLGTTYGYKS